MLGREAYHHPWLMADWDERFFGSRVPGLERDEVEHRMVDYMERLAAAGEPWWHRRATCWACATACPARGAGARSGRTTG